LDEYNRQMTELSTSGWSKEKYQQIVEWYNEKMVYYMGFKAVPDKNDFANGKKFKVFF
jgi:hypothetical protein